MKKERKVQYTGQIDTDFGRKYQKEFLEMTKNQSIEKGFSVFAQILIYLTIIFVLFIMIR